jgi:YVTN family beta-propeller protein
MRFPNAIARSTRRSAALPVFAMLGIFLLAMPLASVRGAEPTTTADTRPRRPVALCFSRDGAWLFVANRGRGSLSVIDPRKARVVAENVVGRGLADVAALPDGRHLIAVDQEDGALVLLEGQDASTRVVGRREVSPDPVSVLVLPDGSGCAVASLRSRRLTFVTLARSGGEERPALKVSWTLDLPFSPRNLAQARDGSKLIVADAFGGKIAVVDAGKGVLESAYNFPGHNIRGLALAPDGRSLAVAHQLLHRQSRTSFEDVHWGTLLSNHLRILRVDALLSSGTDAGLLRDSRLIDLGHSGAAAGDPSALAFDRNGDLVVALAGIDEVALGRNPAAPMQRIGVGRRPTALALSPDGRNVSVANTLDDTVSVIDVATRLWRGSIPLGPGHSPDLAERGERLFFDARLSHDGWMSCNSCHTDGHTNGLTSDTLGDDSYGAPKRVTSLLGVGATGPWMWTGAIDRLEDQVRKSIETTMRGPTPSAQQVEALTAYLRTLAPPRPLAIAGDHEAVSRGREVFMTQKCDRCHAPPAYTTPGQTDVGLSDEVGNRMFNPPSLLGVGEREPYLHDGRARTLEEVFDRYQHPRDTRWTPRDVADLVAFLKTL